MFWKMKKFRLHPDLLQGDGLLTPDFYYEAENGRLDEEEMKAQSPQRGVCFLQV